MSCFAYSSPSLSTEYFSRSSCTISLRHEGQRQLFPNYLEVCHFTIFRPRDISQRSVTYSQPSKNFMVTPCINNAEPFYYQLMHIMLKNTELLKHSKITLQRVSVYIETIFRELVSAWLKIAHWLTVSA